MHLRPHRFRGYFALGLRRYVFAVALVLPLGGVGCRGAGRAVSLPPVSAQRNTPSRLARPSASPAVAAPLPPTNPAPPPGPLAQIPASFHPRLITPDAENQLTGVAFSPDSSRLAIVFPEGVEVWNLRTLTWINTLT